MRHVCGEGGFLHAESDCRRHRGGAGGRRRGAGEPDLHDDPFADRRHRGSPSRRCRPGREGVRPDADSLHRCGHPPDAAPCRDCGVGRRWNRPPRIRRRPFRSSRLGIRASRVLCRACVCSRYLQQVAGPASEEGKRRRRSSCDIDADASWELLRAAPERGPSGPIGHQVDWKPRNVGNGRSTRWSADAAGRCGSANRLRAATTGDACRQHRKFHVRQYLRREVS